MQFMNPVYDPLLPTSLVHAVVRKEQLTYLEVIPEVPDCGFPDFGLTSEEKISEAESGEKATEKAPEKATEKVGEMAVEEDELENTELVWWEDFVNGAVRLRSL